ncbi:VOC family protein [Streptomyces sp. NPDC090306]|uniref:VOC family protein n=1 Tax=Streptomyces sp. NPDC090306 TaxID=3365961 RepID=UPI00380083D5
MNARPVLRGVRTVMVFALDPAASARWWAEVLGVRAHFEGEDTGGYAWLEAGGVELGFHPADDARNPPGASPVVYWAVDAVDATRRALVDRGCRHHRGPLDIAEDRRICQLVDPFGTVFGLDGPA